MNLRTLAETQERWIEVRMQLPAVAVFDITRSVEWSTVPAHRVREGTLEEVIVAAGQLLQGDGQVLPLCRIEIGQAANVDLGDEQGFERPCRPVGDDREPVIGFDHRAGAASLGPGVIEQEGAAVRRPVLALVCILCCRFVGQKAVGPDLAVRVRVRATHDDALVLKDLDPRGGSAKFGALFAPVSMICPMAGSVSSGRLLL